MPVAHQAWDDARRPFSGTSATVGAPDYTACLAVGHAIRRSRHWSIGLLPTGSGIDVEALAARLVLPLRHLCGGDVALVADRLLPEGDHELVADVEPYCDGVDIVHRDLRVAPLALDRFRQLYAHVLVPLARVTQWGGLASALHGIDGIILVVKRGGATEEQVLRCHHLVSPSRRMGVLWLE
jgi:hypothetical protein